MLFGKLKNKTQSRIKILCNALRYKKTEVVHIVESVKNIEDLGNSVASNHRRENDAINKNLSKL